MTIAPAKQSKMIWTFIVIIPCATMAPLTYRVWKMLRQDTFTVDVIISYL